MFLVDPLAATVCETGVSGRAERKEWLISTAIDEKGIGKNDLHVQLSCTS